MPTPPGHEHPLRVHHDEQIFNLQRHGGISRYFSEIMALFADNPRYGVTPVPRRVWTNNEHLTNVGMGRSLPGALGRSRHTNRILGRLTRVGGVHIVHHTFYSGHGLSRGKAQARVVTVYDMIPEIFPELFPKGNPHLQKKKYVEAADLILCISKSTLDDLIDVYGRPSAPVVVTPLAVSAAFMQTPAGDAYVPGRYILFVGSRSVYKDFFVLAEAFASLPTRDGLSLLAVGGGPFNDDEQRRLQTLGIANHVHQVSLSDSQLATAYTRAECFVFPSRYEGFGLPTLEAMAGGCPVILSDSSSHPEVGGDAALYFAPNDAESLAVALARLLDDRHLRDDLRDRGLARVKAFTWTSTAAQTAAAYHALMAGRLA